MDMDTPVNHPYVPQGAIITMDENDNVLPIELCVICSKPIEVMCFKGTGVCSTLCEKQKKGEL